MKEYKDACEFPTNNATSESIQFLFRLKGNTSAGEEAVRKQLANS
jgi:hypothetical protein